MSDPGPSPPPPNKAIPNAHQAQKFWQVRLAGGQEFGPFTESQIRQLVREGAIPASAFLRRTDTETWRPATVVLVGTAARQAPPSQTGPPQLPGALPVQSANPITSPAPLAAPPPSSLPPVAPEIKAPSTPPPLPHPAATDKEKVLGCLTVLGIALGVCVVYGVIRSLAAESPLSSFELRAARFILNESKAGKILLTGLLGLGGMGLWMLKEIFSPTLNKQ